MVGEGSSISSYNSQGKSCCLQDSTTGRSYSSARWICSQCHAGSSENGEQWCTYISQFGLGSSKNREQWCTYISQFGLFLALKTWLTSV